MKDLIKYEFRKIWTHLTKVSVISLIVISTILTTIAFFNSPTSITGEGEEVGGIKSFRVIKEESKSMRGVMNKEYIDNLVNEFNLSKEKNEFKDRLGLDYTRFDVANHIINFINYGKDTFNFMMDLDFDFLKSEDEFYNQLKKSMGETIKSHNEISGAKYTDEEMERLNKKIDKLETPITVDYYHGFTYFIWQYTSQYWLVIIVIVFALSSLFSKDSSNGMDEIILASRFGRKKNMNARIIAGNIFAVVVYGIFIGLLLIEIGGVSSLQGWDQSVQNLWNTCIYNVSAGLGIIIMVLHGLLTVLIIANMVMFLSIKVKYSKISTIISVSVIGILVKLTYTTNPIQLQLNPIYYATSFYNATPNAFEIFYFIGDKVIPYSVAFVGIAFIYMIIIRCITVREYSKYKLN